jgi:hypothetical protein
VQDGCHACSHPAHGAARRLSSRRKFIWAATKRLNKRALKTVILGIAENDSSRS